MDGAFWEITMINDKLYSKIVKMRSMTCDDKVKELEQALEGVNVIVQLSNGVGYDYIATDKLDSGKWFVHLNNMPYENCSLKGKITICQSLDELQLAILKVLES